MLVVMQFTPDQIAQNEAAVGDALEGLAAVSTGLSEALRLQESTNFPANRTPMPGTELYLVPNPGEVIHADVHVPGSGSVDRTMPYTHENPFQVASLRLEVAHEVGATLLAYGLRYKLAVHLSFINDIIDLRSAAGRFSLVTIDSVEE